MEDISVNEVFAASIVPHHGPGMVTGWVAIVEYMNTDGELMAVTLRDPVSPPWKLDGLIGAASDFYVTEEEEVE